MHELQAGKVARDIGEPENAILQRNKVPFSSSLTQEKCTKRAPYLAGSKCPTPVTRSTTASTRFVPKAHAEMKMQLQGMGA